jgi:hypothetical protein
MPPTTEVGAAAAINALAALAVCDMTSSWRGSDERGRALVHGARPLFQEFRGGPVGFF